MWYHCNVYIHQVMADHLGQGRFGDVMRGYHRQKDTNVEVAFKTLKGKAGYQFEIIEAWCWFGGIGGMLVYVFIASLIVRR